MTAYARDFATWRAGNPLDYAVMPEGTIILAQDQVGDSTVVIAPGGDVRWLTSDGNNLPMDELMDGINGWDTLRAMLRDGLMYPG